MISIHRYPLVLALAVALTLTGAARSGEPVPAWFAKAPPLPAPAGETIHVTTAEELLAAVDRIGEGGTILLADGHYAPSRTIVLRDKKNVTLRSAGGDPARVTLVGKGWDGPERGGDILHIGRCEGVTIAGMTFADCRSYGIKVEAETGPKDIHIVNCRFRDIGVRAIKGSAGQDPAVRAIGGSVRYCVFENTRIPPAEWFMGGDYITAIDMMALEDWTFSDNYFRNIKGRNGGGRAAIFIWVRSRKVTVERNIIVDCDRGVAFGNPGQSTANIGGKPLVYVSESVIRNNWIAGGADGGIELWYAEGVQVYHNSIWRPERNWGRGIRIGTGTTQAEVANNLVHGKIQLEGGEANAHHNLAGRLEGYFADPAGGNLELTAKATGAMGQGAPLPQVPEDLRSQARSSRPDLGAWERPNIVQIKGTSFHDRNGPFLGLGASYFQALRRVKYDRARLESDLAFLASMGFNYIRILSMVNWDGLEIAPVGFTNKAGHFVAAWPDYWQQFRDLLDAAGRHGLRVEVTVFADAQHVMPDPRQRDAHQEGILANIAGREHHLMHLEVANEAWQNGFPGARGETELRARAKFLAERTSVPVAITSNDDTSDEGIIRLYRGSAADLATVHFSRDTRTAEGGWLPVRDTYRAGRLPGVPPVSSNEPIGPGASVSSENDPIKLCAAAAFAYIANLPAYVFHSRAGVYGDVRFEETPGISSCRFLPRILPPDLSSWNRNDGLGPAGPLTVFCMGTPNRYWPEVGGAKDGCVRNIGAVKGREFVCLPMGILEGGLTLQARRDLQFAVLNPLTSHTVTNIVLNAGEKATLPKGPSAYILKGAFLGL